MMPTSNYWSVIHGMTSGEAEKDEEGKQIMRILGKNMAYLMEVMENAEGEVEASEVEKKKLMNFIR